MRFFNTAGPVNCQDHYCLPPLGRFDLDEILSLVAQKKYFVLHAPRQTGKTTCLLALTEYLNRTGRYRALYANVEVGQSAREDVEAAMRAIVNEIGSRARDFLADIDFVVVTDVTQFFNFSFQFSNGALKFEKVQVHIKTDGFS